MTNAIEIMRDEHQEILKMLKVARWMCKRIVDNQQWDTKDFYKFIDFVRNFADRHHHGKEEEILFTIMGEELGQAVSQGPIKGMLVEHDLARIYMSRLEEALKNYEQGDEDAVLDIIANTISYTHLLKQHINTEDNTLFPFAEKSLKKETMERLNAEIEKRKIAGKVKKTEKDIWNWQANWKKICLTAVGLSCIK